MGSTLEGVINADTPWHKWRIGANLVAGQSYLLEMLGRGNEGCSLAACSVDRCQKSPYGDPIPWSPIVIDSPARSEVGFSVDESGLYFFTVSGGNDPLDPVAPISGTFKLNLKDDS